MAPACMAPVQLLSSRALKEIRPVCPFNVDQLVQKHAAHGEGAEDGADGEKEDPASPLAWTHEPRRSSRKEGNVVCKVSMPASDRQAREHTPHLVRTTRIEPDTNSPPSSKKPPPMPTSAKKQQITVTEKDLLRCGGDLRLLRKCSIATTQKADVDAPTGPVPMEMSFKSAFVQRCRSDATLRDPWKDIKNPEEVREPGLNVLDRILNQVWVKASKPPKDASEVTDDTPRRRRSHNISDVHIAQLEQDRSRSQSGPRSRRSVSLSMGEVTLQPTVVGHRHRSASRDRHPGPVQFQAIPAFKSQSPIHLLDDSDEVEEQEPGKGSVSVRSSIRAEQKFGRALEARAGKDMRALWLTLEPESGEVILFSRPIALRLEGAHTQGRSSVPLAGLGEAYEGFIAYFEGSNILLKSWDGVCREVRRFDVPALTAEITIHVAGPEPHWSFADSHSDDGNTEQRLISLGNEPVAPPSPSLPALNPDRRVYNINYSALELFC